ncbi:MAG: ABC transporter substrate-binding protein [Acidimicrobiia bacterium]|nr:ABC transporter substrate-binding protein [Acidimicrobiia bacterium]
MRKKRFGIFAVGAVLALAATACGSSGGGSNAAQPDRSDLELVIGSVWPEGDPESTSVSPVMASINLAVQDIRAAGGNVRLLRGDYGTDPDAAAEAVNRLLDEGVHAILGAGSSQASQSFIQTLYDAQIPQCAASNTSPSFSTQENAAFFFRTVPPDEAVSPIVATLVAADGATHVAIPARDDDWGNALSNLLVESLGELGVSAEIISYDPNATSFDPIFAAVQSTGADAVVFVTFSEGAEIIRGLLEAGLPATAMYGTDGIYDHNLAEVVSPSSPEVLNGFLMVAAGGNPTFNGRITGLTDGNVVWGGQAYDCVVVLMLAALAADSTSGPAIIAEVPGVTKGGQQCFSYRSCSLLVLDGVDIDYVGASGTLELDEVGDPTIGRYFVAELNYGVLTVIASHDVDLAELG